MTPAQKPPKSRSRRKSPTLPAIAGIEKPGQVWFSRTGCVVRRDGRVEVLVDGTLLGTFEEGETGIRNVLLVMLAKKKAVVLEHLADAFGITSETLRQIRRVHEAEGIEAVVSRVRGGCSRKVTAALRRRMEALFEQGQSIDAVHKRIRGKVSRASVGGVHKAWADTRRAGARREPQQHALPCVESSPCAAASEGLQSPPASDPPRAPESSAPPTAAVSEAGPSQPEVGLAGTPEPLPEVRAPRIEESARQARAVAGVVGGAPPTDDREIVPAYEPISRRGVQFVGAWLLVAMTARRGLHERVQRLLPAGLHAQTVRVVVDATLIALAAGQKCVEGVRRLATSGAAALLLATGAPSANWTRKVLGSYCREGTSGDLHFGQAGDLIRAAHARAEPGRPAVFFADNHGRTYTGQHRVMWTWRMQDKRPRPGTSDYYVHDRSGRPIFRGTVSHNGSLAQYLPPMASILRMALEEGARILIGFDRGGSFPEVMALLRDVPDLEFVTYERAPYRKLSRRRFKDEGTAIEIDGDREGEKQTLVVVEDWCNLGKRRGRLRRLRLLMPDGHQVNVLTNSGEDAEWLVRTMFGRWSQENGFKHGVQRWGINQLDGRKVEAYSPDTLIPNPKRRRLKRDLEQLRQREGTLRRELARLRRKDSEKRAALKSELQKLVRRLGQVEARHRKQPEHVTIAEIGPDDAPVRHTTEYKTIIDTLRIAAADAESELAIQLAPHLKRPKEAKRALQNLFSAPGDIRVGKKSITIVLDPAGTTDERHAFKGMLAIVNRWKLCHPGDPMRRPLRFRTQDQ